LSRLPECFARDRLLVHKDERVQRAPLQPRVFVAAVQGLYPEEKRGAANVTFLYCGERVARPHHLLRHCWPFRLCAILAATSAQDIPAALPPCRDIIARTIAVSSWTSSGDQAPTITDVVIERRALYRGQKLTTPSLAAMCEMVSVAVSAVGGGSPDPFGYCVPRVA
jgi:hypothetical protein